MIGQTFGRLTVIERAPRRNEDSEARWRCRCECGREIDVLRMNLVKGHQRSCGCLRQELNTPHGGAKRGQKDPAYYAWVQMRQRCNNPRSLKFPLYGGRGVKVCSRWDDFVTFRADVGERPSPTHTLDRIDNDGDYEPGNVRWATPAEQGQNRRHSRLGSRRLLITALGQTKTATEWAQELGGHRGLIQDRLTAGWTVEKSVSTPVTPKKPT